MILTKLNKYVDDGWLSCNKHPTLDLFIYNYTPQTQFENYWDDVTIQCRGLILDSNGNIVGRPFPKFFNIEQNLHTPTENFEVFDKVDGSLIIMCRYKGNEIIATRGSFVSDQAKETNRILSEYDSGEYLTISDFLCFGYTLLFECLYPENRIVVDYKGARKLVMLGAYDKYGNEVSYDNLPYWPDKVKRYSGLDYQSIKELNTPNSEGFVVRFDNGSRCKIKFEDYVRLHKILTNCSTTAIFECLSTNGNLNKFLEDVPDEFYQKVNAYINQLKFQFNEIESLCKSMFDAIHTPNKKKFAQQALTTKFSDVLFKMFDEKDYQHLIWKRLKPQYEKL